MCRVCKGERVELSSRVDLLRYQDDRRIEEDAQDVLFVGRRDNFISRFLPYSGQ